MTLPTQDPVEQPPFKMPTFLRTTLFLLILAGLVTLGGLIASVILFVTREPDPQIGHNIIQWAILTLAGLATCGLFAIGAAIYKHMVQVQERLGSLEQRAAIMTERAMAHKRGESVSTQHIHDTIEVKNLLIELRETLLLPAEERQRRFEILVERELTRGLDVAEAFIRSRDFHRARQELDRLTERFGDSPRIRETAQRVESAAEIARAEDVDMVNRLIQDRIDLAHWDEAERLARELSDKYPLSPEPTALLIQVQRERKLYEQRNRLRLHDEIQHMVNQRRWIEAAEATRRFIQEFPVGLDTDALRVQLETLAANAEIQTRQQLEQQLKELARQHQYWDALALARRIISEYPFSPQANVLRNQLPRLEELAHTQPPQT